MATPTTIAGWAPRPLTVDEVIRMSEAGILAETERVELVDGALVAMSPEAFDHAEVTAVILTRLARAYPEPFQVRSNSTLPLGERTFLEPDVLVVDRSRARDAWPRPDLVAVVVEVARTSVRRDRTAKAALYAAWGARVYWVVDLVAREVLVHAAPGPEGYGEVRTRRDGTLALPGLDATLRLEDVLPPG